MLKTPQPYAEVQIDADDHSFVVRVISPTGETLYDDGGQGKDSADARTKAIAMKEAAMAEHTGEG